MRILKRLDDKMDQERGMEWSRATQECPRSDSSVGRAFGCYAATSEVYWLPKGREIETLLERIFCLLIASRLEVHQADLTKLKKKLRQWFVQKRGWVFAMSSEKVLQGVKKSIKSLSVSCNNVVRRSTLD
eukprot:scaffold96_cov167-Ochromonas_danica.AAC.51